MVTARVLLAAQGLSGKIEVARCAKPIEAELTERLERDHEVLITIEEGARGGFGSFVLHHLAEVGALDTGLKVRTMHLPDIFQDQDKPDLMYEEAGLNARQNAARAIEALGRGDVAEIERFARA